MSADSDEKVAIENATKIIDRLTVRFICNWKIFGEISTKSF